MFGKKTFGINDRVGKIYYWNSKIERSFYTKKVFIDKKPHHRNNIASLRIYYNT